MRIVRSLEVRVWQCFVSEHPQGNVFHTPEMFQVFAQAKGHRPTLRAVLGDDERILALLLPVQVTLSNLLHRLTTRSIAYGSILVDPGPKGTEALDLLLRTYVNEVDGISLFTELRNLSNLEMMHFVMESNGFIYEDHLDYLIDLDQPVDKIMQNISKSGRKAIRRSERRGVIAEEVQDRSLIPIHYGLLQQSYEHAQIPLADISLFEAVFDILVPKGMAKMLLAQVGDQYVAASLEVPYKDVIYSWYSGYDPAFSHTYPNDGLVWHILEWGALNGYRCFDFGGAGKPGEDYGPRDFKAKFGGRLVNFGRYTYVHSPTMLTLSRIGYQFYRQIMYHLPS